MDTLLSLLNSLIAFLAGIVLAVGSFFGSSVTAAPAPEPMLSSLASSTPATSLSQKLTARSSASSTAAAPDSPQKSPGGGVPPTALAGGGAKGFSAGNPVEPTAAPQYSTEELNAMARAALVNILCTTKSGGTFNPISGSGVIIDSRGIILTNAHVAQYFLLRDYPTAGNVECVVRVGSPAQPRYTAELMYLPPSWIAANAGQIASSTPTGTGEHDFALLRITGTTNPSGTLPASFPALPLDGTDAASDQPMLLAAYPAGFLGGISITLNLYQTSAVATVGQLYSFFGEHVDLFSLGGTVVSQSGSSGGAAVNSQGKLQGIIVTELPANTTALRDLRAISIGHINRTLAADGLGGILGILSADPATFAATFNKTVAPTETKVLEQVLGE